MAPHSGKRADDPAAATSQAAAAVPKDERAERLAAALRDNLRRRKAQARGRRAGARDEAHEDAGAGDTPANDTLT